MRRIVFVTQQIDPEHPNLAAATAMVQALAERVDEVVVIALRAVPGVLPENCRVYVIGADHRVTRGLKYGWALVRALRPRPIGLVAHMSPIYAVLAAPLLRPMRVPVVLWFTHWKPSRLLRVSELMSNKVVSVARGSFPLPSDKVVPIGHGIDMAQFPCQDHGDAAPPLRAVALGRTSPAKGLEAIVKAVLMVRERGVQVQLEIRGPSETQEERDHLVYLQQLASDAVRVEPPVPRTRLPEVFAETDVLVNNTAEGSLDKVVFEACASCLPVLASNPSFVVLLEEELRFDRNDVDGIARGLTWMAGLSADERRELGHDLRRRVEADHSSSTWAQRILEVVEGA
ncbi:MAG TPA: glycosyltransferase family 4 protein [Gaiellaceae bacterium]|nr:glycosyltransferase family 4 protein [Gaiellaceae bacterium]